MRHIALRYSCLIVAGCAAILTLAAQSMGREWHLGKLLTFEAEVESYDGKDVYFKIDGDKVRRVAVTKLNEEDQEFLKTTYPNGKAKATKEKAPSAKSVPATASSGQPAAAKDAATTPPADTPGDKPADLTVELVSLTVTKPNGASAGLVPGTHATLLVSSPSQPLQKLDAEKTKIVCADDRANNLGKPVPGSEPAKDQGALTLDIAPDGKSGTIVFDFPRAPTAKATRIRLKGELHLLCGTAENAQPVTVPVVLIVSLGL